MLNDLGMEILFMFFNMLQNYKLNFYSFKYVLWIRISEYQPMGIMSDSSI